MNKEIITAAVVLTITLVITSCASIFNGVVLPNQCQKCDVIDKMTDNVEWSTQGCGSANTNLERDAKVKAYDLNEWSQSFRYEVRCSTWTDTTK